jgi:hypothetical protein
MNGLSSVSITGSIAPYFKPAVVRGTPPPPPPSSSGSTSGSSPTSSSSDTPTGSTSPTSSGSAVTSSSATTPTTPPPPAPTVGSGIGPFFDPEPYEFTDEGEPVFVDYDDYYPVENPIEEPPYEPVSLEEPIPNDFPVDS